MHLFYIQWPCGVLQAFSTVFGVILSWAGGRCSPHSTPRSSDFKWPLLLHRWSGCSRPVFLFFCGTSFATDGLVASPLTRPTYELWVLLNFVDHSLFERRLLFARLLTLLFSRTLLSLRKTTTTSTSCF
ncbi:hypothetical protein HDK77DRAFT_451527 [Phyllosticta capitalensis]